VYAFPLPRPSFSHFSPSYRSSPPLPVPPSRLPHRIISTLELSSHCSLNQARPLSQLNQRLELSLATTNLSAYILRFPLPTHRLFFFPGFLKSRSTRHGSNASRSLFSLPPLPTPLTFRRPACLSASHYAVERRRQETQRVPPCKIFSPTFYLAPSYFLSEALCFSKDLSRTPSQPFPNRPPFQVGNCQLFYCPYPCFSPSPCHGFS